MLRLQTATALGLSVLMTVLAGLLIRLPQGNPYKTLDAERVENPGTLQLAWLLGKRLWIAEEMAKPLMPSKSVLRTQGKTIVQCFVQPTEEKDLVQDLASRGMQLRTLRKRE